MKTTLILTAAILPTLVMAQTAGRRTSQLESRALEAGDKVIVATAAGDNVAAQVGDDVAALQAEDARKDNPHEVTKSQLGLGNVNNTSDAEKPISDAAQSALASKSNLATASVSPEDYSGTDQQRLVAAFAEASSSGRPVELQAKVYALTERLDIPGNVVINGNGATLDGSATAAGGFTDGVMVQFQPGTITDLADTSATITKGTQTITLAAAPSLARGDVIIISDETDFSYSAFRSNYRAGEFAIVQSVSGSNITTMGRVYADYSAGMKVAKQSSGRLVVRDLKVVAPSDSAVQTFAVRVDNSNYPLFENVEIAGGSYTSLSLRKCYGAAIVNCHLSEDGVSDFGGDYALAIVNSQSVKVTGGTYRAARHAITIGGNAEPRSVVSRDIVVSGVLTDSNSTIQSIDTHGNAEYVVFTNSVFRNGVKLSGNFNRVSNNTILSVGGGVAILVSEASGLDLMIDGNTIEMGAMVTSRGAAVDLGGNGGGLTADTPSGGTLQILNNRFAAQEVTDSNEAFVRVFNRGYAGSEPIRAIVSGNLIENRGVGSLGAAVRVSREAGNEWDQFILSGNTIINASVLALSSSIAISPSVKKAVVEGNTASGGKAVAITANHVSDTLRIASNNMEAMRFGGIQATAYASAYAKSVNIENNEFTESLQQMTGSSTTNTFAYVLYADHVRLANNFTGSDHVRMTLSDYTGTFVVGEAVTGSTSGATGVVTSVEASKIYVSVDINSAAFVNETVAGGTSLATATSVTAVTMQRLAVVNSTNTLWHSGNVGYTTSTVLSDAASVNP